MAISTVGGATSTALVSQPIGITQVLKQGYSSTGSVAFTPSPSLPAGTYAVSVDGNTNSNIGVSAIVGSKSVFAKGSMCVLTTANTSNAVSVVALDHSTTTLTTSTTNTVLTSTSLYSVGVYNWAFNGAWKFKNRIFTISERYVTSVDANLDLSKQATSNAYIGTTYANALNAAAACDNFAVVSNNTGSTNISNAYSTDGVNWTTYNAPFTVTHLKGGGNTIIGINFANSTYYTTTDGYTWTTRTAPFTFGSTAYNPTNATWYATQWNTSTTMWKSTDAGVTWTSFTLPSALTGNTSYGSYNWRVIEYIGNGYMFLNVDYNYTQGFVTDSLESGTLVTYGQYGSSAVVFYNRFASFTNYNSSVGAQTWAAGSNGGYTTFFTGDSYNVAMGLQMNNLGQLILVHRWNPTNYIGFRQYSPTLLPSVITFGKTNMEVLN